MVGEGVRERERQELIRHKLENRRESRDVSITIYCHEAVLFEQTHHILFTSSDCLIFGLFQAKRVVPYISFCTYGAHIWWHFPWITQVKAIDAFRLRNLFSEKHREKTNCSQMFERVFLYVRALLVLFSLSRLLRMIVVRLFFLLSLSHIIHTFSIHIVLI